MEVGFLISAFFFGFFGSVSYITALYFNFVGSDMKVRELLIHPFKKEGKINIFKIAWYCSIGGFIALVFQTPTSTFVPIQNFILGVTWPATVSQYLSGRMGNPSTKEMEDYLNQSEKEKQTIKLLDLFKKEVKK
jgi:hypothetical protein